MTSAEFEKPDNQSGAEMKTIASTNHLQSLLGISRLCRTTNTNTKSFAAFKNAWTGSLCQKFHDVIY